MRFHMNGIRTDLSLAFRVNLNILSKPVPFLLELFLLILQLSQRALLAVFSSRVSVSRAWRSSTASILAAAFLNQILVNGRQMERTGKDVQFTVLLQTLFAQGQIVVRQLSLGLY